MKEFRNQYFDIYKFFTINITKLKKIGNNLLKIFCFLSYYYILSRPDLLAKDADWRTYFICTPITTYFISKNNTIGVSLPQQIPVYKEFTSCSANVIEFITEKKRLFLCPFPKILFCSQIPLVNTYCIHVQQLFIIFLLKSMSNVFSTVVVVKKVGFQVLGLCKLYVQLLGCYKNGKHCYAVYVSKGISVTALAHIR